jgi:hypothetical protein
MARQCNAVAMLSDHFSFFGNFGWVAVSAPTTSSGGSAKENELPRLGSLKIISRL